MRKTSTFIVLSILLLIFVLLLSRHGAIELSYSQILNFVMGDVDGAYADIFWQIRVPKIITAILAGSALAVAGLVMQTFFQNPLAGPFVLGINSGASLGVALFLLGAGLFSFVPDWLYQMGPIIFAILGSFAILFVLLFLSFRIPGKIVLLVIGIMFGHLAGGLINILVTVGEARNVKTFLLWNLGSFSRVDGDKLILFSTVVGIAILLALTQIKTLNVLLLGERYAKSLGLSMKRTKLMLISLTALLAGGVTAFCGPISFLGVIVPHLARALFKTNDHAILVPVSILMGACLALFAELIGSVYVDVAIPLNAIMGLLGAPVIFIYLWQKRRAESL